MRIESRRLRQLAAPLVLAVGVLCTLAYGTFRQDVPLPTMALLVPDDIDPDDPLLATWMNAAAEEGFPIQTIKATDFTQALPFERMPAGIILPDSIHRIASDRLVDRLERYVQAGGKLMAVFDAASLMPPSATYAPDRSRLSDLLGIDHVLYDSLRGGAITTAAVLGVAADLRMLRVPPGRFVEPALTAGRLALADRTASGATASDAATAPEALPDETALADAAHLSAYQTETLRYPHFVTRGAYRGRTLLFTEKRDVLVGQRGVGAGDVLFVNVPLGYLAQRTDGMMLHVMLRHFGTTLLGLPRLSNAPDGIGALVMNWHLDSNAALPALRALRDTRIFEQGPYSVHVTAGPDTYRPGDGMGLDVDRNAETREWMRFFAQRRDEIGSHGGWIHNYFAANAGEQREPEFERYLMLNRQALESATGRPVTEYSSPSGVQPDWITEWLEQHDIFAYYFTGHLGMGPTRLYDPGRRSFRRAWAFPILVLGTHASFEELHAADIAEREVGQWLEAAADFVADTHSVRMVYFHPPGVLYYPAAVRGWLDHAIRLRQQGRFTWRTMTDVARFLDRRAEVEWHLTASAEGHTVVATHPTTLAGQAWRLPADRYERPVLVKGDARISRSGDDWLVRPVDGKVLSFRSALVRSNASTRPAGAPPT